MRERWRRRALRQLDDPVPADVAVSRKQAVGEKPEATIAARAATG
jgi:uncharacterized protein YjiS (DUF1127 family)